MDSFIAAHAGRHELVDQPGRVPGITRDFGPFVEEAVQPGETKLDDIAVPSPSRGIPRRRTTSSRR